MGLYVFQKIEIWTPIWDPHGLPRASKIDPGRSKSPFLTYLVACMTQVTIFGTKKTILCAVRSPPHQMSSRKANVTANCDVECSN